MEAKSRAHKGETNQKELPGEKTKLRKITYIINSVEGLLIFNRSKRGTVASL